MDLIKIKKDKYLIIITLLSLLIYLLLSYIKPSGIFWSLDEGGKLIYIESVLQRDNPSSQLIYPGQELDPFHENIALFFYSEIKGDIFSWWPVGFPLLSLPFYLLLGFRGLYVLPALAGAMIVFLSGKITKYLSKDSEKLACMVSIIVAFCSPIFFYSVTFWEHTLSVAFLMLATFLLLTSNNMPSNRKLIFAGIFGSISVFFRTEAILLLAGYWIILFFIERRKILPTSIGFGITTIIWALINYSLMGYILSPNVQAVQNLTNFNGLLSIGLKYIPYTLFNAPIISAFDLGRELLFLGTITFIIVILLSIFSKLRFVAILFSFVLTSICLYVLLQPGLYRSVHGFLLICPIIALVFLVYRTKIWNEHKNYFLFTFGGITVFFLGFFVRAWLAAGGLQWGPRYMLAMYPLLIIPTLIGIKELINLTSKSKKIITKIVVIMSILVGFGYQIRGYYTMYLTMDLYQQSATELRNLSDEIIITECTWMPMVIPDLYWNGNIFTSPPKPDLVENIGAAGKDSYLSIEMQSCNTTYIDEILNIYKNNPGGLIIKTNSIDIKEN